MCFCSALFEKLIAYAHVSLSLLTLEQPSKILTICIGESLQPLLANRKIDLCTTCVFAVRNASTIYSMCRAIPKEDTRQGMTAADLWYRYASLFLFCSSPSHYCGFPGYRKFSAFGPMCALPFIKRVKRQWHVCEHFSKTMQPLEHECACANTSI
jgi:hypothetical protein